MGEGGQSVQEFLSVQANFCLLNQKERVGQKNSTKIKFHGKKSPERRTE